MNAKVHTRFEKFLSSFLVFVMVLSLFPSTVVMAADSTSSRTSSSPYPDTVTVSATNYDSVDTAYKSVNCGTCYFHKFYVQDNVGNTYPGFCTDHTAAMSSRITGTFSPTGRVFGPYDPYSDDPNKSFAALPYLDWYWFHLDPSNTVSENWSNWTVKYTNAWVQCAVWLAIDGVIDDVYYLDTDPSTNGALDDIRVLAKERVAAVKHCGGDDSIENCFNWMKGAGKALVRGDYGDYKDTVWVEYKYDNGTFNGKRVQPLIIPVKGAAVLGEPAYLKLLKVDGADTSKVLPAVFGVYADAACTQQLTTLTVKAGDTMDTVTPAEIGIPEDQQTREVWVKEIQAPEGYSLNSTIFHVKVDKLLNGFPADAAIVTEVWKDGAAVPMTSEGMKEGLVPDSQGNSYVMYDWNLPGTKDLRSNGATGASISTGSLIFETSDNGALGENGIPSFDIIDRCRGSVAGVNSITREGNNIIWNFSNGKITFSWLGWYTMPTGGEKVTEAMKFPSLDDDHGTGNVSEPVTYYGQWRVSSTVVPTGGNPGEGEAAISGQFFTVYWDYQSNIGIGGGATACLVGTIEIKSLVSISSGGMSPVNPTFKDYTIKAAFSVPDDPQNYGYTFKGWCLGDATGAGTLYQKTDASTMAGLVQPGSTFYAVWEPEKFTVAYDANGGSGAPASQQFTFNKTGTLAAQEPTREGYNFIGWALTPYAADAATGYSAGQVLSAQEICDLYSMGTPVKLYAVWEPQRVIVTWTNTQYSKDFSQSTEYKYGDKLTYIGDLTNTEGWDFVGWESDSGVTAAEDMTLDSSILEYHPNDDESSNTAHGGYWGITFKGQWEEKKNSYTAYVLWLDDTDNDGVRPSTVDLFLTENSTNTMVDETKVSLTSQNRVAPGQQVTINGQTYTSDGENLWSYTWKDLPITWEDTTTNFVYSLYLAGSDGQYGDYSYGIDDVTSRWSGTVVMTHKLITRNFDVQVVWDDQSDNDNLRPDSVTLSLYARNSATSDFVKLTDSAYTVVLDGKGNVWNYTFTDLPRYKDGYEIQYSIRPNGEDIETASGDLDEYTIDYKTASIVYLNHENITQDVTGTVIWNDDSNRDGHRPDDIKLQLYKDGVPYLVDGKAVYATLNENNTNSWTYTFQGVEQLEAGSQSYYSIRVVDVNEINAEIATKDGVTDAYRADYSAMTVVMSHEICRSDVVASVKWDDDSDRDGIRPDQIRVELYADGTLVPGDNYTVTTSGIGDTWNLTFGDMPEYTAGKKGQETVYTIKVQEVNKDELYGRYILTGNALNQNKVKYTASYEAKEPIATLTHVTDTTTTTLAIEWGDSNNNDNSRPDRVLVSLMQSTDGQNWTLVSDKYVLTPTNGWKHTVENLPKYDNGREIQYKIALNPGQPFVLENGGTYAASSTGTLLRLVRDASLTYVTARVDWDDQNDQDKLRPTSVNLELYAQYGDAEPVLVANSEMVATAETEWKATWTSLPLMRDGSYVKYSVKVVNGPDGYTPIYGAESEDPTAEVPNNRLIVRMVHSQIVSDYEVTVVWNDNSNNGGKRPSELPIALYANGVLVTGTDIKIDATNATEEDSNVWKVTYENLPVNINGTPIDYTVKIYGAYANSDSYSELTAGLTLYMSMAPITQDLNLKFFFEDNNNADGTRPTRIKLTLTANGEVVSSEDPITITNPNGETTDSFIELPIYSSGTTKINYGVNVEMLSGGDGYAYTVYGNGEGGTTATLSDKRAGNLDITFSKTRDVGTQSGAIYWYDTNNQWNNRPETLTVYLWNDKTTSRVGTYTLNVTENAGIILRDESGAEVSRGEGTKTSDVWTYTIPNLPLKANGENITYRITVAGSSLDNFYPTRVDNIDMNASLTMKGFDPTTTRDFRADVRWVDNNNAWNTRDNVVVTLLANDVPYKTVNLTAQNVSETDPNMWTYVWKDIPTYIDGVAVVWSVTITDLDRYTESFIIDDDGASFTMTQCFGVDFTVNWNDKSNDDGVRPESLQLEVYGQGSAPVATVTFTGAADAAKWTASVEDLPVWKSGVNTTEQVAYNFVWQGASDNSGTYADLISNLYTASAHLDGSDEYDKEGTTYHFTGVSANKDYENAGVFQWETVLTHNKAQWEEIPCTIVWDDDGDRDGLRPESIQVQLLADGVAVGEPVTVTGSLDAPTWSISWEDLEKYVNLGTDVTYTIQLVGEVPQYTHKVSGVAPLMTTLTMSHELITFNVAGTIIWDDDSQLEGTITRTDVDVQFYCNGVALGDPINVPAPDDNTKSTKVTLDPQYVYSNHGTMNAYTFELKDAAGSDPTLSDLVEDGYTVNYNFDNELEPEVTIRHDFYDVSGYVHFRYNTDDDYLVEGADVTVYLVKDGVYSAVGSGVTDANGKYYITGIPSGDLEIRAIYNYQDHRIAGKSARTLDRIDLIRDEEGRGQRVDVLLNYDAANDDYLYKHNASGRVLYEQATVGEDGKTVETKRTPAANANILVYKVNPVTKLAEYVTLTKTNENGEYSLTGLVDGTYQLTVYCTYEDVPYVYDNENAVKDGLTFALSFADAQWNDIVVKLPSKTPVKPVDPVIPPEPPVEPEPCVVDGYVYFEVNGVHTTEPVSGVDVFIYDNGTQLSVAQGKTDANGSFSLEGIQPGSYTAVYSYAGHASRVQVFTITQAAFDEGTFTVNPVYFAKNDNTGLSEISGTILDDAGNPYDVLVYVYKMEADGSKGELSGCAYTDEYGHYEFLVAAGSSYLVEYRKIDTVVTTEVITYPAAGDSDVHLDYYTVSGVVTDNEGNPVSGAVVNLYYKENIVKNFLTGADGAYSITNIAPENTGKYTLEIFFADGHSERHYLTLGYDAPVISGTAPAYSIKGEADAGTTATLRVNESGIISTKTTASVSSDGTYEFTGIPSGDYEILISKGQKGVTEYVTIPSSMMSWSYTETISGDVIDSIGRVRTANVTLLDKNGAEIGDTQVTLADGHYEFTVPNGTYSIRIAYPTAGSVLTNRTTKEVDSYGASYPSGMTVGNAWVYNLNAEGASGTVKDQDGRPIANAQVVLTSKTLLTPEGTLKTYTATTDENGNWYIGVPAGDYTVRAMLIVDSTHSYFSNENPDLTVALNTPVTNLTITRYDLTGSVVRDGDGNKLASAEIVITNESNTVVFTGTTDSDGKFQTVLLPGEYKVTATYSGQTGSQTVSLTKDESVTVKVSLPYTLSGTVTNEDGTPAKNAIVYYSKDGVTASVSVKDDGSYSIALGDGKYEVYASNGTTSTEPKVITLSTDKTENFVLSIPQSGYTIEGVVVDNEGNRLENAIVSVLYGDDKKLYKRLSTDSNGEFSISGVPDNEYYLSAQWTKTVGDTQQSYVTYADTTVVVPSDAMDDVVLTVLYREAPPPVDPTIGLGDYKPSASEATYQIDGIVKDADGKVVEGATVILFTYNRDTASWVKVDEQLSGADGAYLFEKLQPAIYRVDISFSQSGEVTAEMGNYVISGYAMDDDGNPYENARVNLRDANGNLLYWDTTDARGFYEFGEIAAGNYQVEIIPNVSSKVPVGFTKEALEGTISGSCGVGDTVTLYNEDEEEVDSMTSEDGTYEFTNIPVGNYKVVITPVTGENTSLDIDCSDDCTEFTGTKFKFSGVVEKAGNPVEGALVEAVNGEKVESSVTTKADGKFEFVLTLKDGDDYKFMVAYPADSYTQVISAAQNLPVLTESSDGKFRIDGTVLDAEGNGIYQARVNLYKADGTFIGYFKTALDGSYNFRKLNAGSYYLEVEMEDGSTTRTYIEASSYPPASSSEGSYTISGVAKDSNGKPVNGAYVEVKDLLGHLVISATTGASGLYNFTVLPGTYTVEITYPSSKTINTENGDATADSFNIFGYVIDEEETKLANVDVTLSVKNADETWTQVDRTTSDASGYYLFTGVPAGTYLVHIGPYNETTKEYIITVPSGAVDVPPTGPDKDPVPDFDKDKITFKGVVQTNNGHVLKGAVVFIVDEDSSPYESEKTVVTTTTKQDGSWIYGNFETSHYTVYAQYTHKYGMNESAENYRNFHADANKSDFVLTITLSYTKDVNADGLDETVYAGLDDIFDTADDHYIKNINGEDERVYPGADLIIGTKDDEWFEDVNGDGKDDTIYVGEDRIAGTEDDFYLADPDKDSEKEPIYASTDKTPGTDDDWWPHDVDKDGTDEIIHVGPDATPGTEDDWYNWDINKDGVVETVVHVGPDGIPGTEDDWYEYPVDGKNTLIHVGPDGIPGTEDDWYEKDMDKDGKNEKVYVGPDGIPGTADDWWTYLITFNGNGGLVNNEPVFARDVTNLTTMPNASRTGYNFNGWYTKEIGGSSVSLSFLRNVKASTTVYAHWTENQPVNDNYIAYFDANGGTVNGKTVDSMAIKTLTSLPTPVRANYTFDGWFTSVSNGNPVSLNDLKSSAENVTVYAHWTKNVPVENDYEIMFNANGGKVKGSSTYTTNSGDIKTLPTATRSGYTFDGWYSSKNGGSLMTLAKLKAIEDDIIVYAHWTVVGGNTGGGSSGGGTGGGGNTGGGGSSGGGGGSSGGGGGGGGGSTVIVTPPKDNTTSGAVVQPGVGDYLITDDHIAYLAGYTDGSFGPNRNMTRGEAAQMFYRLLKNKNVDTSGISFKDVPDSLWCATAIKTLAKVGVVAGYNNGCYGPNDCITRAQFATMTVRFLKGEYDISNVDSFKDVKKTDWFYQSVMIASKCGWVNGYGNGYFGPNDKITRAQVTTLVNNMLGRTADKEFIAENKTALKHFTDVRTSNWFYLAVTEATNAHDFYRNSSGVETDWTSLQK